MENLISYLLSRRLGNQFLLKMVSLELWDWRPQPGTRSMSELANHLACAPICLLGVFRGEIKDIKSYKEREQKNMPLTPQEFPKIYETGLIKLVAYLKEHIEDAHTENIRGFYQHPYSSLYKEVLHGIGHEWLHLGQLFLYLKQNGVEVDDMAYYGHKDPNPMIPPNLED